DRFVPDREVPAFFRRADIVALPYRDAEQSGVLYTALAFGKAIVMSDVGGFPEVAARGAGKLVASGDAEALAAAIGTVLADPAQRERLEAGAHAAATGPYSWDAIAAQTLELYRGRPRERLEVIVASDGSTDRTAELAREAGADLVLELPRGGKVAALNAAVERSTGDVLAFSDANAIWEAGALARLVARIGDPEVGYV